MKLGEVSLKVAKTGRWYGHVTAKLCKLAKQRIYIVITKKRDAARASCSNLSIVAIGVNPDVCES